MMRLDQMFLAATLAFGATALVADELPGIEESPVVDGRSETDPGLGATGFDDRPGPGSEAGTVSGAGTPDMSEDRFDELDIDQNEYLSRAEAEADPDLGLIFLNVDEDGDGRLSSEEFTEYEPDEDY